MVAVDSYLFSVSVGIARCAVLAAFSGVLARHFQRSLDVRSARYCAGGDGAARHIYHAKHVLGFIPRMDITNDSVA
jgi:hypothetical protein